jgi:hypothetical protein
MARILISESRKDIGRLLERMVARLGHEPLLVGMPTPEQMSGADALVLEPAAPIGSVLALAASTFTPTLPLICAGVTAPPADLAELGVVFAATVITPFTAEQLDRAIAEALRAASPSHPERVVRARRRPSASASGKAQSA